jgi:hypothetical protein
MAQIMAVTGQKSASSVAVYQRVSSKEKQVMGDIITSSVRGALHELSGWCRFVKGIFKFFIEEKNIFCVHTTVLSLKTAFNLVKIHLLFRIMILIQVKRAMIKYFDLTIV